MSTPPKKIINEEIHVARNDWTSRIRAALPPFAGMGGWCCWVVVLAGVAALHLNDPIFDKQWHLLSFTSIYGINVEVKFIKLVVCSTLLTNMRRVLGTWIIEAMGLKLHSWYIKSMTITKVIPCSSSPSSNTYSYFQTFSTSIAISRC